jgi:hypothetical protein
MSRQQRAPTRKISELEARAVAWVENQAARYHVNGNPWGPDSCFSAEGSQAMVRDWLSIIADYSLDGLDAVMLLVSYGQPEAIAVAREFTPQSRFAGVLCRNRHNLPLS